MDKQLFFTEGTSRSLPVFDQLDIHAFEPGSSNRFWFPLVGSGLGVPVSIPVMVTRGIEDGPIMGMTAAVHGNELNGLPIIHRLFNEIDPHKLRGTIIGMPVVNVPAFLLGERRFNDGVDLNHIMPGKEKGTTSEVYSHRFFSSLITPLNYLVDLHTASFGRVNSYYIRADMENPVTSRMASLQGAQIIVHNPPHDGTLRGAAADIDIPAITLEVGDPNKFQKGHIRSGLSGIFNLLVYLNMIEGEIEEPETPTVVCKNSYWIYTNHGGILSVMPEVTDYVKKDQKVATVRNIFGDSIYEYIAPESGIVIGKSTNPVNQTGSRILHLGILK